MNWLWLGALGGVVGLDATSFAQVMISRPLVAATLTGLLFGRPVEGAAIGVVLEAFALLVLPVGAARYPDSGPAAVAATGGYMMAASVGFDAVMVLFAVVFALAWEQLAGGSVSMLRRLNERITAGELSAQAVERRQLAAMALDFIRAGTVAVLGALIAAPLLAWLAPLWPFGPQAALGALAVAAAVALAATLRLFAGWGERRVALGLGVACGLLIVVLT